MQRVFRVVPTAELTPMDVTTPARLVRSVRDYGVLQPVLLREAVDADGVIGMEIVDGNRRVAAAIAAGLDRVPAVVLQDPDPDAVPAMTVIANTLRSRNPVSESEAVERLSTAGHDAEGIMRLTGLTRASLENRLRPSEMHADLRRARQEGRLAVTVWERASKLPMDAQQRLADLLETRGVVRTADVEGERRRLAEAAEPVVRDDVDLPETEAPGSREQLAARLAELAAFAREIGLSEYDWNRMATVAWRAAPDES